MHGKGRIEKRKIHNKGGRRRPFLKHVNIKTVEEQVKNRDPEDEWILSDIHIDEDLNKRMIKNDIEEDSDEVEGEESMGDEEIEEDMDDIEVEDEIDDDEVEEDMDEEVEESEDEDGGNVEEEEEEDEEEEEEVEEEVEEEEEDEEKEQEEEDEEKEQEEEDEEREQEEEDEEDDDGSSNENEAERKPEEEMMSAYADCLEERNILYKEKNQPAKGEIGDINGHSIQILSERHELAQLERQFEQKMSREIMHMITKPISIHPHWRKKDTLFMALEPNSSIYFQGITGITLLVGSAEIFGYHLRKGEERIVYSLPSHSLLRIKTTSGEDIESITPAKRKKFEMPPKWLKAISNFGRIKLSKNIIIVTLRYACPPVAKLLYVAGWPWLFRAREDIPPYDKYGLYMINKKNYTQHSLYLELPEWKASMNRIKSMDEETPKRIILGGGKSTGKSTLFKYVVNGLLEDYEHVLCLDIDPGQPELSVPTSISLTRVNSPLLGPACTQVDSNLGVKIKQLLIGATSPEHMLEKYVKAVQDLFKRSKEYHGDPLVVNTMGWCTGLGLDVMLDVIRSIQPSHVFQLGSHKSHFNFRCELDRKTVQKRRGGILTRSEQVELAYTHIYIKSMGKQKSSQCPPHELQEMTVLAYISKILENKPVAGKLSLRGIVKINWGDVALHVLNAEVPRSRILQVMNASLVALCKVDPCEIVTIAPHLPKQLVKDGNCSEVIGWGIVRGIDPLTRELYILTDLEESLIKSTVNAVIQPELQLPQHAFDLFAGISGKTPYMEYQMRGESKKRMNNTAPKPRRY